MVKISTKYPLTEEQTALLDEKKQHWWLKDLESGGFVSAFPRLKSSSPIDIDLEIVDSKYCLGCGDWNVVDEQGYHCSKRVYFKVSGGTIKYFKNKAELDADTSESESNISTPSSFGTYSPFKGITEPSIPSKDPNTEEVSINTDIAMYCVNDNKIISRNYNCVMNFTKRCSELNEDDCFNCIHGRQLFYRNFKDC